MSARSGIGRLGVLAGAIMVLASATPVSADPHHGSGGGVNGSHVRFYVPKPDHGAVKQIARLRAKGAKHDAALIKRMIDTPQAVWFTAGTRGRVRAGQDARRITNQATAKGTVPVLVAYNIPLPV